MTTSNVQLFQERLGNDPSLRQKLEEAVRDYAGDTSDNRAVFQEVIAPIARSIGIGLDYADAIATADLAARGDGDLTDDELELIAGGAGTIYRMLVNGAIVTAMVTTSLPMRAIAAETRPAATAQSSASETIGNITYSPDFLMSDIATPDGVTATADGLEVSKNADRLVSMAAKAEDSSTFTWSGAEKTVGYTSEILGYVDKDAGKVGKYGQHIFGLIKSGFTGDFDGIFGNGVELLKLIGIIDANDEDKAAGVTNEELQEDVKSLRALCSNMSTLLSEDVKQSYQNRLVPFDNAIGTLGIDCNTAERMLKKADKIIKDKGLADTLEQPGELTLPPAPERPERPTQPEMPAEPTMPTEPTMPELPAEPVAPVEGTDDYQALLDQYNLDHDAWQAECDKLTEEYQAAHDAWQAECDKLNEEYQTALDAYNSFSMEDALKKYEDDYAEAFQNWLKECERIGNERTAQQTRYNMNYADLVVKTAEEQEKAGNKDFKNFTKTMDAIETNFKLVAVECAKSEASSPFHAFDSYWAHYFNYDTQGYYLRVAYRANAEYALKRSYALIATYYNMGSQDDDADSDVRVPLTEALRDALNGIDAIPAGTSPNDVINSLKKNKRWTVDNKPIALHCNTFNRDITLAKVGAICDNPGVSDDQIDDYVSRLHGRTVKEDLELAGIVPDVVSNAFDDFDVKYNWKPYRDFDSAEGIVMKTWTEDIGNYMGVKGTAKKYYARVLMWDGTVQNLTTCRQDRSSMQPEHYYPHWFLELRK